MPERASPLLLFPCFSRWGRPPEGGEVWRGAEASKLWKQGPRLKSRELDKRRAPLCTALPPGAGSSMEGQRRTSGVKVEEEEGEGYPTPNRPTHQSPPSVSGDDKGCLSL